jgi:hypothetical protein
VAWQAVANPPSSHPGATEATWRLPPTPPPGIASWTPLDPPRDDPPGFSREIMPRAALREPLPGALPWLAQTAPGRVPRPDPSREATWERQASFPGGLPGGGQA